jgi:hypothetical protein
MTLGFVYVLLKRWIIGLAIALVAAVTWVLLFSLPGFQSRATPTQHHCQPMPNAVCVP